MFKHIISYGLAKVLPAVINLAIIYYLSHFYTDALYGEYLIMYSITTVTNSIFFYWQRLTYLNKCNSENSGSLFSNIVVHYLLFSIAVIITLGGVVYLTSFSKSMFFVMCFACFSQAFFEFKTEMARSRLESNIYAMLYYSRTIFFIAFIYILISINNETSPQTIMLALALSYIIPSFFYKLKLSVDFSEVNTKELKRLFVYGFPIIISYSMEGLISTIDRFFISMNYDSVVVAHYTTTYLLYKQSFGLIGLVFYLAIYPVILIDKDRNEGAKVYSKFFVPSMMALFIVFTPISNVAVRYFLPESFVYAIQDSLYLFIIFTFLYVVKTYFLDVLAQYFNATKYILHSSIIIVIMNCGLNYILVPIYSINGALYSTVISYLLGSMMMLLAIIKMVRR